MGGAWREFSGYQKGVGQMWDIGKGRRPLEVSSDEDLSTGSSDEEAV